jgi:hypothetical protein
MQNKTAERELDRVERGGMERFYERCARKKRALKDLAKKPRKEQ